MREFLLLLFQMSLQLRNPIGAFSFIPHPVFCVNAAPPKKEKGPVSKSISQSSPFLSFFHFFQQPSERQRSVANVFATQSRQSASFIFFLFFFSSPEQRMTLLFPTLSATKKCQLAPFFANLFYFFLQPFRKRKKLLSPT
jgi:hypothetical protein